MKSTHWIMLMACLTGIPGMVSAQLNNEKSFTVSLPGSCEACKALIETAGSEKQVSSVRWDTATRMATIEYDEKKSSSDAILRKLALAGFDNEKYLAPESAYLSLPDCCRYPRLAHSAPKMTAPATPSLANESINAGQGKATKDPLAILTVRYMAIKDGLLRSDAEAVAKGASEFQQAMQTVQMDKMAPGEHDAWMKIADGLRASALGMAASRDIEGQRTLFIGLSANMYTILKDTHPDKDLFYDFCPMANEGKGAHWLSFDAAISNPYYGEKMPACGRQVEKIQ